MTFAWLVICLPVLSVWKGNIVDFGQYYMGGLIVRSGDIGDLYPIPNADAKYNAGWPDQSKMQPGYAKLAEEAGVGMCIVFYIRRRWRCCWCR